jgi:hypothetical protein
MSERPPDRFLAGEGRSGWFSYLPSESRTESGEPWQPPPEGSVIRLMGDYTVTVPLWSEGGLMFSEPEELVQSFDVSRELAFDLQAWAIAWDDRSGEPDHGADAEAATLVRRLQRELAGRYQVLYHP